MSDFSEALRALDEAEHRAAVEEFKAELEAAFDKIGKEFDADLKLLGMEVAGNA